MQQAHNFKRNLFTLKIVGNTLPAHSFFPNTFLSPPQKMPERLLGVLCKHLSQRIFLGAVCFQCLVCQGTRLLRVPAPLAEVRWPPVWDGCSWHCPQVQNPPATSHIHPISFHTHWRVEGGHKELNLHAAPSKNVRFLKNTPQEAEIH